MRDRLGLAVIDLQGSEPAKLLVRDDVADIREFQWVNDQRLVFTLIQLDAGGGDQRFGPGLFSVGLDGTAVRMLVNTRRNFVAERQIGQPALDANHHLLAVPAGGSGDEVVVGQWRFDGTGELESELPVRLNVVTGRSQSLGLGMPDRATHSGTVAPATARSSMLVTSSCTRRPFGNPPRSPPRMP